MIITDIPSKLRRLSKKLDRLKYYIYAINSCNPRKIDLDWRYK